MPLSSLTPYLILVCSALGISTVHASEWDELIDEFQPSEKVSDYIDDESLVVPDKVWDISSTIILSSSWNTRQHKSVSNTNYTGLSQLRSTLKQQYDYRINPQWKSHLSGYLYYDWVYLIRNKHNYTDQVLDSMESEIELRELWVAGQLRDNIDIRIGRQIVTWGKSDAIRILDILNPTDNREIGMTSVDEMKLPVTMIKTDIYSSSWAYSLIAIPEIRFSKNPPFGSDYSIIDADNMAEPEDISDTSWAISAARQYPGWDLSLYAARHWRDIPYLDAVYNSSRPITKRFDGSEIKHDRITTIGLSTAVSIGSYLLKSETAFHNDVKYTTSQSALLSPAEWNILKDYIPPTYDYLFPSLPNSVTQLIPSGTVRKNLFDILAGIEFYGLPNTTITMEVALRHIIDFESSMKIGEAQSDRLESFISYTRYLMNNNLKLSASVLAWGPLGDDGAMFKFASEYQLSSNLLASCGFIYYKKGDLAPFSYIDKNDRLFFSLAYDF
jgi:hypothetical protein